MLITSSKRRTPSLRANSRATAVPGNPAATATVQGVVERAAHILLIQSKEDMDAWRLDVSIDHRDALTPLNQAAGQIGGEIGFAGISTKGVDGDDGGYAVGSSCRGLAGC